VFQALGRGAHAVGHHLQGVDGCLAAAVEFSAPLGRQVEGVQEADHLGQQGARVGRAARGDGQRQQHAGDGRVDARFQKCQPQADAQQRVGQGGIDARPVEAHQGQQKERGDPQAGPGDRGGVEDGDHHNRAQVVGDGQGGEEYL
jgi:hypothetical protein